MSHLFGLFLELGLLFQYAGTSLRCKCFDHWEKILSPRPYTAIITRMSIQSVISAKLELSVPPENESEVLATKVLTSDDHIYLKRLRENFHDRIHKLDKNDTLSDLRDNSNSNLSDNEENNNLD